MRPLIGITCGRDHQQDSPSRQYQNESYVRAILLAGGVPLLIPLLADKSALRALYLSLHGLLLSGGGDLDPTHYGEPPHPRLGNVDAFRDRVELTLTRWAMMDDLPLLAICRGIQVLNVALGGSLYQDIPSQISNALPHPHQAGNPRCHLAHAIEVERQTLLAHLFRDIPGQVSVNSMHHQAVRVIAPGFVINARAPDGVIEGIEHSSRRFALGVQWHPEELVPYHRPMRTLFGALVAAARERMQKAFNLG